MDESREETRTARQPGARMRTVVRRAWTAVAVVAAVIALSVAADLVTASPAVCGACHEMQPALETWRTSGHSKVGCPDCHEDPRPWYRFPETLGVRGAMLTRDFNAHFARADAGTSAVSVLPTSTIPVSRCEGCHDPSRKVSMKFGTLIDHTDHAKRNGDCLSCHLWTAHPEPGTDKPLLMMRQCFDCHGRAKTSAAPGTCETCHPASFELVPPTHAPKDWKAGRVHGVPARKDRTNCTMCHEESFCFDCHRIEMPHPAGWNAGRTAHGPVAKADRGVCRTCHTEGLVFCSMCHHEGYRPAEGTWAEQHPKVVGGKGSAYCFDCHAPTSCTACHTSAAAAAQVEKREAAEDKGY
ncbi:MAG: hypothetical protein FDZ70_05515 [Actinobacteria bacterium]|nr:MAG: hypothetical protein FDZ70_05515 [Actinomycetota bacterium]